MNEKKLASIFEIDDSKILISKNGIKQPGLATKSMNSSCVKNVNELLDRSLTLAKNVETKSLKRTSLSTTLYDDEEDEDLKLMDNQDLEALFMMQSSKRKKI
jgi:hypothetical protein